MLWLRALVGSSNVQITPSVIIQYPINKSTTLGQSVVSNFLRQPSNGNRALLCIERLCLPFYHVSGAIRQVSLT
jgi:hypothetical protein